MCSRWSSRSTTSGRSTAGRAAEGHGKIEGYQEALWNELIAQVEFSSLNRFKCELREFDSRYNH